MNKRIAVNLAFFASIGIVLSWWAVNNVLQFDVVNRPYTITAEFENSPGLQSGFDVAYLGTPIGRIGSVNLQDGHVDVALRIEHDRDIPEGSSLAVRRKSAVGEPYVDVIPPEGASEDGPFMDPGAHIPLERTQTPLSYAELFDALNDLLSAVPEDDLRTVFDEFAAAIDGRSQSLRDMITGGSDSLDTFAEDSALIEEFTANMARLMGTLADHSGSIGTGLENTELFTESLANSNADIARVLSDGSSLATRTADLLAGSASDASCIIGSLSTLATRLGQDDVSSALVELLATGPRAAEVFLDAAQGGVIAHEEGGSWVRAIPPINIGGEGEPVEVYPSPRQLPDVPAAQGCPAVPTEGAPSGSGAAGEQASGAPTGPTPPADVAGARDRPEEEASSEQPVDDSAFNPLIIMAVLLGIGALGAVRPWRWLPSRGGAG